MSNSKSTEVEIFNEMNNNQFCTKQANIALLKLGNNLTN